MNLNKKMQKSTYIIDNQFVVSDLKGLFTN